MAGPRGRSTRPSVFDALGAELQPRLKEWRYSLHLLRNSLLAMVGLIIVLVFVVLAIVGPSIAPYSYTYNSQEKNAPPMTRPLVTRDDAGLDFSGTGWNNTQWMAVNDGLYARSESVGDRLIVRRFDFEVYTDFIAYVAVRVQENSTLGAPGSYLAISVSWDNGTTWSDPQDTILRYSDVDDYIQELDFSSATSWTKAKLSEGNFALRVVHEADPTFGVGPIGVDLLRVVVRFQGIYHALGTTVDGEDVLSGLLMGAPISMRIGIIVVVIATLIGSLLGAMSGYFGGAVDELIMRITDIFLSIPGLILAMAVAAALGRNLDNVMYALIVVWWPAYTRLVRGQALSVRENTYIEAARASGASEMRVVTRHILPNTLSPILVQASLDIGSVVLVAAGLSFLGLGAQPGTPEWGLMVSRGFNFFPQNWWQVTFSGLTIFFFVLGFNLLGDGVRDITDPRLRR